MNDRNSSSTSPTPPSAPLWAPHELGFVGLDWFENMLAAWFEMGRAHSAQAVHAARDLSNAATAMMSSAVATSLARPARSAASAAPASDS